MKNFNFKLNANLKDFCTFRIGGKARFLFIARTINELIDVCKYAKQHNIRHKIIGLGANLLFDDLGFNGIIIVNQSNKILFNKNNVLVDAGTNLSALIVECCNHSLSGLENLFGIPSTIGGAVVNSLGAFNTNFSDFVEYVECYHKDNLEKCIKIKNKDCKFDYRSSLFKYNNYIITRVKLKLNFDDVASIKQKMANAIKQKASTQPLEKFSAGSIFKRCDIIPAKAIDDLGLKGTKVGDAEISTKHAGFIVNNGNATSNDVKKLIKMIKEEVKSAYNTNLELEIEIVN